VLVLERVINDNNNNRIIKFNKFTKIKYNLFLGNLTTFCWYKTKSISRPIQIVNNNYKCIKKNNRVYKKEL
jgi:hypothetical protein